MDAANTSKVYGKDSSGEEILKQANAELHVELQKIKRSEEVTKNFARALLSTLKQYKDKLKESENEVRYLKESLRKQSAQTNEMEKELNQIRNLCSCRSNPPLEGCAEALTFNHCVSMPPILSDPDLVQDTDALPDENNTPMSPDISEKKEMDQDTKTRDESLFDTNTPGDRGELSLPLHRSTMQQADISAEAYANLSSGENAELSYQYLDENPESFQKLTQCYVQVGEMDDVVMKLSDISKLTGPHGNAPVNIPSTEPDLNGKASNHLCCFPRPMVPPGEGCVLHLPGSEETSIMQDEKEQSEEKVTMTQNVQQSATCHSTETLKSAEDDPALKPLNFERPKRKLLPASAIHFKDFNGLFMDENAMEIKRKKTGDVKARSDGSISLIRILKSNLPR